MDDLKFLDLDFTPRSRNSREITNLFDYSPPIASAQPRVRARSLTPRPFRFRSKNIAFTYSRCPISREAIVDHVKSCLREHDPLPVGFMVARERHSEPARSEDDTPFHLHVWVSFNDIIDFSDCRMFDVKECDEDGESTGSVLYHPRIEPVRSKKALKEYYLKEDIEPLITGVCAGQPSYVKLAEDGKLVDAINTFKQKHAFAYFKDARKIHDSANFICSLHTPAEAPLYALDQFNVPPQVCEWTSKKETHTLVLFGPTGTGKTSIAQALLPQAVMSNSLEPWIGRTEFPHGIIIDDPIDIKNWDNIYMTSLCERERARCIKVRFYNVNIPAKTPMIICTNIFDAFLPDLSGAIARRCIYCNVTTHLKKN